MDLAIDIGGTNTRAIIYKEGKSILSFAGKNSEAGLVSFIEETLKRYSDIKTIGISYAGQVKDGVIIDSPNIRVDVANIRDYFKTKYNISLYIQNDLTCAVIAEAQTRKSKNISALYVGTGLGLGVISDGNIMRGSHNLACEIGHIPYKKAPFKCGCGRDNCLENFASGSAIIKWMDFYKLRGEATLKALKDEKNPKAKEILKEFQEALLYAIGGTITLFNPEILVLGGGVIEANPYLLGIVLSNIDDFALKPSLKSCKIVKSELINAPLIGASLLKNIS